MDDAAQRQASFTDVPALKFAPIVHRRSEPYRRCLDISGTLAVQDADGHLGRPATQFLGGDYWASDDTLAKIAVEVAEYGRGCTFPKSRQHSILFVRYSSGIYLHDCVKESRARRQGGGALHHVFLRQVIEPLE